ncbi:MAG: hypothetical protein IPL20_00260 [Saprospiraceae bacterium]|nr:hypothetical protein [Saprospiraceae bacterium]MBK8855727.1 hypothetical protein [Saprospiraceae bacterium]
MKTILIALFFSMSIYSVIGQQNTNESKHLTFKGVPIDGTLNEYVLKMKKNGFVHEGTEDGIAFMRGEFAGYKDCVIGIATLKEKDLVHKIVVLFSPRETWSDLSGNYFNLKEMLTEKYGEPSEVVEKFDSNYQPDDDDEKMYKVKFDNCKYYSVFETEKGTIELSIDHESVIRCFVLLKYFDKINGEIFKAKAKGDL